MVKAKIRPGKLSGKIAIPPSQTQTIHSLLFALMAKGKSVIRRPLPSQETISMLNAIRTLGAVIDMEQDSLFIEGVGGHLQPAEDVIHCGNSGYVLRLIGAIASLGESYSLLTGDLSVRHSQPALGLLNALTQLGALAVSSRLDGYAPIVVKGPLKGGKATLDGRDAEAISGLLLLGAFTPFELHVKNPAEKSMISSTLNWFDRMGIAYENQGFDQYKTKNNHPIKAFEYTVPGDINSAVFPIVAGLITNSQLEIDHIELNNLQQERNTLLALESMGGQFEWNDHCLIVKRGSTLKGTRLDLGEMIEALPILAVAGCFANSETELVNAAAARRKESDRIRNTAAELKKMGAEIEERPDGLIIRPSELHGSNNLESHRDPNLAMALTVAALRAEGESLIRGVESANRTYPGFFDHLAYLGGKVELE